MYSEYIKNENGGVSYDEKKKNNHINDYGVINRKFMYWMWKKRCSRQ